MDRRTRTALAIVLVAVIAATAAAALLLAATGQHDPAASPNATAVVGVIVNVQSQGLDRVSGFTLRTTDQRSLVFTVGDLENGVAFPPGHLVEHQSTGEPIRVWYRVDGATNVAIRIEDAS